MNFTANILHRFHLLVARSGLGASMATKIRNQCNLILRSRFGLKDMNPYKNGEYHLLNHLNQHCRIYFDVGANKGDWSNYLLSLAGDDKIIYLYEPGLLALAILRQRFKDRPNIRIQAEAIADKVGELFFYEEAGAGELSSLVPGWANENSVARKVKTSTIDEEIKRLGLVHIDFLKIDVEGFDLKVLYGASNSILKKQIGFIQFEYNSPWFQVGSSLKDAFDLLQRHGYAVFLVKENGLYTYDISRYGDFYAFSNFLAVSPVKAAMVSKLIKGKA